MTIFDADVVGMQNVHTPLTSGQHFGFCLIATAVYLLQFYKRGGWHYLLIMLAVDLTYVTQTSLCTENRDFLILGIAEALILGAAMVLSIRFNKRQKAARLAAEAASDEAAERRTAAENEQREHDEKLVDNAFDE